MNVPPAVFSTDADQLGVEDVTLAGTTARAGPAASTPIAAKPAIDPTTVAERAFFTSPK